MRGIERRSLIMKEMEEKGHVDVSDLAEKYQVTSMTIRRDLAKLEEENLVIVEYGGAVLKNGSLLEHDMSLKNYENIEEKQRIAKACNEMICDGESVFLDAGTTTAEVAKLLSNRKNMIITTNSLLVANILARSDNQIIMCPGAFRKTSMAYMGQLTDAFIKDFHFDKVILAVEGIHYKYGVSVPDILDGVTKKAIINQSDHIICVADHTKFNKHFYYKICDCARIETYITDSAVDEMQKEELNEISEIIVV